MSSPLVIICTGSALVIFTQGRSQRTLFLFACSVSHNRARIGDSSLSFLSSTPSTLSCPNMSSWYSGVSAVFSIRSFDGRYRHRLFPRNCTAGSSSASGLVATTNYTIVEESGIYGKLKSGAGWVQLKDEQPTFKPYVVRVLSDVLNIRKEPTTQSAIVNTLRKNSAYTMVEEQSGQGSTKGWGKLKSGAGWISLDFVEFVRYA